MIDQLVLKEEIIDCFYSCAKKADYRQLFDDYSWFFAVLVENLEKVKKSSDRSENVFAKNLKHFLDTLKKWRSGGISFCQELSDMEKAYPEFVEHFRGFGSVKDWDKFYNNFREKADRIIERARKQEKLDFKIECAGLIFDNFEKRDKYLDHCKKLENELSQTIKEVKLSEARREEHGQEVRNEWVSQIKEELELSRAKLEEDGQNLRNELMNRFECQAQEMENRISETNEKIDSMNRKLAHFNSSLNEKFNSHEEQLDSMQLVKKIGAWSIGLLIVVFSSVIVQLFLSRQ